MDNRTYKELEKEQSKIYKMFNKYTENLDDKTRKKFWKVLAELIDVEINMEKFCNN